MSTIIYKAVFATMKTKKLYLVKREVIATSISQALTKPGKVYEIVETTLEAKEPKKIGYGKDK